ncbi:hypothetical protein MTR67_036497 [Solanum verrucosum]|uniref:Uncharacterized protein n=1 Tax=Solanum verrucosum TaxID=315347 RepID=A0AAF0ZL72_SOLVR|nr:hypothetical protein MTR67_036497 [Solanum verrucosum]
MWEKLLQLPSDGLTNVDAIQSASKPSLKDAFHVNEKYILEKVYFLAYFKGFPSPLETLVFFLSNLIPSRRASELSICIGLPDWLIRNHQLIVNLSRKNGCDKIQRVSWDFSLAAPVLWPEVDYEILKQSAIWNLEPGTVICSNLQSGVWNCNMQSEIQKICSLQSVIWNSCNLELLASSITATI